MTGRSVTYLLSISWQIQNIAVAAVVVLMVCLLTFMLMYMLGQSLQERKKHKWRMISDMLINKAIFYEERDEIEDQILESVLEAAKKLTGNKHFRKFITGELISAKKNISGASSDSLKQFYLQLGLEQYALRNLDSRQWYVKAQAIQELTIMDTDEFIDQLQAFTDDKNEYVRMEAQAAMVQFKGFEGLDFLDAITYPLSNWQQIKLLQLLSARPPSNIGMDKWFSSQNPTVVIFALKLARNYHRFELHDAIASCLDHDDADVRLEAIRCLNEIYTDETSDHLIAHFLREGLRNQVAMAKVMQTVGTKRDELFLFDLLTYDSDELKLHAARALVNASKDGLISLEKFSKQSEEAIARILMHIKAEKVA
ncbi:MAG TPA: HEAT repeat domain-containing protein [Mucilaginibacter sp.]|nr:HEAT repeat domain-containing protein [Mucilaginibacter sp.]